MKVYAKHICKYDGFDAFLGNEWHLVEKETVRWYPSGLRKVVYIKGKYVKADNCQIVYVFEK